MVGPLFSLPQAIYEQTLGCTKAPKIQTICAFWFIWNHVVHWPSPVPLFAKIPYLMPGWCLEVAQRGLLLTICTKTSCKSTGGLPCHTHPFSPRSQRLLLSNPESSRISLKLQDPLLRQLWTRMCYTLIPHQHGPQDSWKGGYRSRQNRQHHQESLQLSHQDDGGLAHSAGGRG